MGKRESHKGSAYERKVAMSISLWITDGLCDDAVWRSAMSGGRTTLKNRKLKKAQKNSTQAGDFDGNSPEGIEFVRAFYCDSKHLSDLEVAAWIYQKQGKCRKSIDPVWTEAAMYGRIPLGLFKENQRDHLALTDIRGFRVFREAYRILTKNKNAEIPFLCQFFREIEPDNPVPIYVFRWSVLQSKVSWAMVREVLIRRKYLTPIQDTLMTRPLTGN